MSGMNETLALPGAMRELNMFEIDAVGGAEGREVEVKSSGLIGMMAGVAAAAAVVSTPVPPAAAAMATTAAVLTVMSAAFAAMGE